MASRASVTVSIAADTRGMLRRIPRVSCVDKSTSRGKTEDSAGIRRTSSNVRASWAIRIRIKHLFLAGSGVGGSDDKYPRVPKIAGHYKMRPALRKPYINRIGQPSAREATP